MAMIHWTNALVVIFAGACTKSNFKADQDAAPEQPAVSAPTNPEAPSANGLPNNPPQGTINNGNQTAQPGLGNSNANATDALGRLAEEIINLTGNGPNNVPGGGGETPLVLDWNRDGRVSTLEEKLVNSLLFDIDGDGTLDFIEWVSPADALLTIDRNSNGRVDSGLELFGNATHGRFDATQRFTNGFAALAEFDDNHDQKIDKHDAVFGRLLLWRDINLNATSEENELVALSMTDVKSISLGYRNLIGQERALPHPSRSQIGQVASYTTASGQQFSVFDLYFHVLSYGRESTLTMLNHKGGK